MKPLIVANWKCNPTTLEEAKKIFKKANFPGAEVVICPPFIYLSSLGAKGAQDCFWEEKGAYTGEISPKMLRDLGVEYVIIGHSERRVLGETDEIINKKVKAALKAGLKPILCIGEKKGQDAKKIVNDQLKKDLKGIIKKDLKKIIVAYEPVWAIGTGNFCSAVKAGKIRKFIKEKINNTVLYGGSVNSKIAKDYLKTGFDGLLVGGASLNAKEFRKIAKNA